MACSVSSDTGCGCTPFCIFHQDHLHPAAISFIIFHLDCIILVLYISSELDQYFWEPDVGI